MTYRHLSVPFVLLFLGFAAGAAPKNAGDPVRIHGTVVLKSLQHETVAIVRSGDGEGAADHAFHIWSEHPVNLNGMYRVADVEYTGPSLIITLASEQTVLTFTTTSQKPDALVPQGFATTGYAVMGLNHEIGDGAARHSIKSGGRAVSGQSDCTDCDFDPFENPDPWNSNGGGSSCSSGGSGATACSTTNSFGSCSVSCSSGFYACCTNNVGSPPTCGCR